MKSARRSPFLNWLCAALAVACALASPRLALAAIGPSEPLSAAALTAQADLVVKGRVVDVDSPQPQPDRVRARIRVDAVLKGEWSSDTLLVWVPGLGSRVNEWPDYVTQDQYAIFFLS